MPTTIFHNGHFHTLPPQTNNTQQPTQPLQLISPFDAGFTHAVGLFETINAGHSQNTGPWAFQLSRHLRRLTTSATQLALVKTINTEALAAAVLQTLTQANLPRARVRLTLTPGDLSLLPKPSSSSTSKPEEPTRNPTIIIHAQPATTYPKHMFDLGVTCTIANARANPLNPLETHKTLNYWWRLRELQLAATKNAAEAIIANTDNTIASACVSNIFITKNHQLHTPPTPPSPRPNQSNNNDRSATLPGTTRQLIIDLAQQQHIPVHIRPLTVHDLLSADEIFLTNASWGVLPVANLEAHSITNTPGEITRALRNDYLGTLAAWQDNHTAAETSLAEHDNPQPNQPHNPANTESWLDPSAKQLASEIDEDLTTDNDEFLFDGSTPDEPRP